MSQQLCELCVLLVEQVYGTLPSTIFSILSARDRLSLPQLTHYSRQFELSPRYVKHGLAVLVERYLAFHYESLDDGITYFEANLRNAYDLTRTGKYAHVIESHLRFGQIGADIVADFQSLGCMSRSELRERFVREQLIEPSSSGNGFANIDSGLGGHLKKRKEILDDLFDSRHIVVAKGDLDFFPPYEFHDQIEFDESRKYLNGPKGKEKKELARLVLARKRHERDDNKASFNLIEDEDNSNSRNGLDAANLPPSASKGIERARRLNNGRGYAALDGAGDSDVSESDCDIAESREKDDFLQSWGLIPTGIPQLDGPSDAPTGVRRSERLRSSSVERSKSAGLLEAQEFAQSEAGASGAMKPGKATRSSKRRLEEIAEADEPEQTQEAMQSGRANGDTMSSKDTVKSTRSSKRQRIGTAEAGGESVNIAEVRKSTRPKSGSTKSTKPAKAVASSKRAPEKAPAKHVANDKGELEQPAALNGGAVSSMETDNNAQSLTRRRTDADSESAKTLKTTRSKATIIDSKASGSIGKPKRKREAEASDAEEPSERPTKLRKSSRLNSSQPEVNPMNGTNKRLKQLNDNGETLKDDKELPNGDHGDTMNAHGQDPDILGNGKTDDSQETPPKGSESAESRFQARFNATKANKRQNAKKNQNSKEMNEAPLSDSETAIDNHSVGQLAARTNRVRKKLDPLPVIKETPTSELNEEPENVEKTRDAVNQNDENVVDPKNGLVGAILGVVNQNEQAARQEEDADSVEDDSLEPKELFFRINHEKFTVSMRSYRLVEMAKEYLGSTTSEIFGALLSALDWEILRCHDPYEPNVKEDGSEEDGEEDLGIDDDDSDMDDACAATTQRIEIELGKTIDLSGSQGPEKASQDTKSRAAAVAHLGEHGDFWENKPHKRLEQVEEHLKLLAQHSHEFVHSVTQDGVQKWEVDFDDLCSVLLQQELENVISARFDQPSARIICFLNATGKLDEKELADLTLIPQKDLRAKLAKLHEVGYIDLQEIPRDASRQPSRTIYLWHFDRERCRKLILDDTYKAMARLIQRVTVEKEKVQRTIDKSERTDVVGREDELLNTRDKEILQTWRAKEEKIWVQVGKLDDMVAVLRDFLPLNNVI